MVSSWPSWIGSYLTCHLSSNCTRSFRRVIDMTEDTRERRDSLQIPRSAPVARRTKRKLEEGESRDEIYCFQRIRVLCKQQKISPNDRGKLMTCNQIWFVIKIRFMARDTHTRSRDRLQSMERFRNGEIDVDNLCAELRSNARCSERGAVVDEKVVDRILKEANLSRAQDQANWERASLRSSRLPSVQCVCGISEDDGNIIFCTKCGTWQHYTCYYSNQMVSEFHVCNTCERNTSTPESTLQRKRLRGSFSGFHDDREPDLNDVWPTSPLMYNVASITEESDNQGMDEKGWRFLTDTLPPDYARIGGKEIWSPYTELDIDWVSSSPSDAKCTIRR